MAKGTLITVTSEGMVRAEAVEVAEGEETGSVIYQKLYDAVGGPIETIPLFETVQFPQQVAATLSDTNGFDVSQKLPCAAFFNENGKVHGMPHNEFGTALWAMALIEAGHATVNEDGMIPMRDICNGPIIIVIGDEAFMATI